MFIKFVLPLDIEFRGSGEGSVSLDISCKRNVNSSLAFIHRWDTDEGFWCIYIPMLFILQILV